MNAVVIERVVIASAFMGAAGTAHVHVDKTFCYAIYVLAVVVAGSHKERRLREVIFVTVNRGGCVIEVVAYVGEVAAGKDHVRSVRQKRIRRIQDFPKRRSGVR